jgi:hypothetical protein
MSTVSVLLRTSTVSMRSHRTAKLSTATCHCCALQAQAAATEKAASDKARTLGGAQYSSSSSSTTAQQPTAAATLAAAAAAAQRISSSSSGSDSDDDSDSDSEADVFDPEQHRIERAAALPTEPQGDALGVLTVQVRSRGPRLSRRFLQTDKLVALFDYCEAAGGALPQKYR